MSILEFQQILDNLFNRNNAVFAWLHLKPCVEKIIKQHLGIAVDGLLQNQHHSMGSIF